MVMTSKGILYQSFNLFSIDQFFVLLFLKYFFHSDLLEKWSLLAILFMNLKSICPRFRRLSKHTFQRLSLGFCWMNFFKRSFKNGHVYRVNHFNLRSKCFNSCMIWVKTDIIKLFSNRTQYFSVRTIKLCKKNMFCLKHSLKKTPWKSFVVGKIVKT